MNKFIIILIIVSTLFLIFTLNQTAKAQEIQDVVYLKNGSIIRGIIVELYPDSLIKIETRDGNLFVFTMEEIYKISKSQGINQKPLTRFDTNIKIGRNGFLCSWGLTVFGAALMGDQMIETTAIPAIGPFLTIIRIENDPEQTYLSGGKELLTISGTLQTFFMTYYIVSVINKSKYFDEYGLYIEPDIQKQGIRIGYRF